MEQMDGQTGRRIFMKEIIMFCLTIYRVVINALTNDYKLIGRLISSNNEFFFTNISLILLLLYINKIFHWIHAVRYRYALCTCSTYDFNLTKLLIDFNVYILIASPQGLLATLMQ